MSRRRIYSMKIEYIHRQDWTVAASELCARHRYINIYESINIEPCSKLKRGSGSEPRFLECLEAALNPLFAILKERSGCDLKRLKNPVVGCQRRSQEMYRWCRTRHPRVGWRPWLPPPPSLSLFPPRLSQSVDPFLPTGQFLAPKLIILIKC